MEPTRVKINISGIQRNVSPAWAPTGSCQDVVNLRPRDGALRPILAKKVIHTGSGLADTRVLYAHDALPHNEYLAQVWYVDGDGNLKGKVSHINISGAGVVSERAILAGWDIATPEGFEYTLNFGFNVTTDSEMGELLSVSFIGDAAVISTSGKTTIHLFRGGQYRLGRSLSELPDILMGITNQGSIDLSDDIGEHDTYPSLVASYLENISKRATEKKYDGHLLLIAAYRMKDATLVRQGPISHHIMGRADGHYEEGEVYGVAEGRIVVRAVQAGEFSVANVHVSAVKVGMPIRLPQDWADVISAIEIYAARINIYNEPEGRSAWNEEATTGTPIKTPFTMESLEEGLRNTLFHRIESIPVVKPQGSADIDLYHQFNVDLTNLQARKALDVDPLTHHDLCFHVAKPYNGRLHVADTRTYLFRGHMLYMPDMGDDGVPFIEKLIGASYTRVATDFSVVGRQQLLFRVYIDTDDGQRVVERPMDTTGIMYKSGSTWYFPLPKVITYPHMGAKKFEVVTPMGQQGIVLYEGTLKGSEMYGFNYHICGGDGDGTEVLAMQGKGAFTDVRNTKVYFKIEEATADFNLQFDISGNIGNQFDILGELGVTAGDTGVLGGELAAFQSWFNAQVWDVMYWEIRIIGYDVIGADEFSITFRSDIYELVFDDPKNHTGGRMTSWMFTAGGAGTVATGTPRVPILQPAQLRLSAVENPFVFPLVNSYQIGADRHGRISDISPQAAPTSEGQFGQYPFVVFTTSGIYLLDQGADIAYTTVVNISQLQGNRGVMGIEGGVMFTTKDGIYLLQGRQPQELNRYIAGNYTYLTEDTATDENPLAGAPDGLAFIQGALFAFDSQYNEVVVANAAHGHHYRFNPQENMFVVATEGFHGFMVKGGLYQGYRITGEHKQDLAIADMGRDGEASSIRIYYKTNPQNFSLAEFKRIMRAMCYCDCMTVEHGYLNLFIFGGNLPDRDQIPLLQKSLVDDQRAVMHMMAGRTSLSVRYFTFMLSGLIDPEAVFHHLEAEVQVALPGRIR